MKLGFIGTGAIVEAFIHGMLSAYAFDGEVLVSRRGVSRSLRLAKNFDAITVSDDNQSIVDQSEWIFLGVLPNQAESVLTDLVFREQQTLFSMVAGFSLSQLTNLTTPASVARIIPMPPIEFGIGPIVITPPHQEFSAFVNKFGTAIEVENEDYFTTFSASSAIMASFFELIATHARWMESYGVPESVAANYATSLSRALAEMTCQADEAELQEMADECLTAGGLNEQVLQECKQERWFEQMQKRLDRIASRLGLIKPV